MGKRTAIHTKHAPHFYFMFGGAAILVGIFATLIYTTVFAQTTEVIYACVHKNSGDLRIVTATESCKSNETALNWNKQGPTGPQGESGSSSSSNLPFSCSYCILYPVADKLKGKDLSYAMITRSEFQGSDLSGTSFKGAVISNSDFSNTNLSGADFTDAGNYPGWSLANVDFNNANLTGANFTNANLSNASNMRTANVTDVIWNNTTCPDGTNSDSHSNTCAGHF